MAGFDPTASTIRIQRMLNARRPGVSLTPLTPIVSKPLGMPHMRMGRAEGGVAEGETPPSRQWSELLNVAKPPLPPPAAGYSGDAKNLWAAHQAWNTVPHEMYARDRVTHADPYGGPMKPEAYFHPELQTNLARGGIPHRADGGLVDSPSAPVTGPVVTATGGRTDAHPVHVPNDAYVIPAENVAHIGEGNTLNGFKLLQQMFGAPWGAKGGPLGSAMPKMVMGPGPGKPKAPYPAMALPQPKPGEMFSHGGDARGGHVAGAGGATPIMISGGEFVVRPEEVARRGNGDISKGHKILDEWNKHLMKKHIETLKKLPGPAQ